MKWKSLAVTAGLWTVFAASLAGAASFDYMKSVDEVAEDPLTAYSTVYLGMPRADFGRNFSVLPDWTYTGDSSSYEEQAERTTQDGNVTVTEGLSILAASTDPKAKVLAFDNYFITNNKTVARDICKRLASTVYANMENFPIEQTDQKVIWVQNDVTIVVSYDGKKDKDGNYIVHLRRFNNHVLSE